MLFPVVMQLDFYGLPLDMKAIGFGILVLCVVEVGLIAPPVGLNVYVINSLARHAPLALMEPLQALLNPWLRKRGKAAHVRR